MIRLSAMASVARVAVSIGLLLAAGGAVRAGPAEDGLLIHAARADGRIVAVGEGGRILLSDDDGETWRPAQSVPVDVLLTSVFFADDRRGWATGHDAVILKTDDAGETWTVQYRDRDADAPLLSVALNRNGQGVAVGAFSLLLETADGGETWRERSLSDEAETDDHLNGVFEGPEGAWFIAAEFGTVYRRALGEETFTALETGYQGSFWGGLVLPDGAILVHGMRGNVWRSEDLGESWTKVESGTRQSLSGGLVRDGTVYLAGLGGAVAVSRDGGRRFAALHRADRQDLSFVLPRAEGGALLFGTDGVSEQTDLP